MRTACIMVLRIIQYFGNVQRSFNIVLNYCFFTFFFLTRKIAESMNFKTDARDNGKQNSEREFVWLIFPIFANDL